MLAAAENAKEGHRDSEVVVGDEVSDVLVHRRSSLGSSGLADGNGDRQEAVGSKFVLVLGAVQLIEFHVTRLLLAHVNEVVVDEGGCDGFVDVLDGLQHPLTLPHVGVLVSKLQHLMGTVDCRVNFGCWVSG